MGCYLCGYKLNEKWRYRGDLEPDKYQALIGKSFDRSWWSCSKCELWQQDVNLENEDLNQIYLKYRDLEMRGTTVKEEFDKIKALDRKGESENNQRTNQLLADGILSEPKHLLDIGSGFGIFPHGLKHYMKSVSCIEPNPDSAQFINELGIDCFNGFYEPGIFGKKDIVTLVHVLEHMRDPIQFLKQIRESDIKNGGVLYVEVPDACEFDYLPPDHDEFNSTHMYMFDMSTLIRVLQKGGFKPWLIRSLKYPKRQLTRISVLSHA